MSVCPEFLISLQRTFNISYEAIFIEERLRELSRIRGEEQHIVGGQTSYVYILFRFVLINVYGTLLGLNMN